MISQFVPPQVHSSGFQFVDFVSMKAVKELSFVTSRVGMLNKSQIHEDRICHCQMKF